MQFSYCSPEDSARGAKAPASSDFRSTQLSQINQFFSAEVLAFAFLFILLSHFQAETLQDSKGC